MKNRLIPILAATLLVAASGCSSFKPSPDPVSSVAVQGDVSKTKVRAAILSAANERGWVFSGETDNDVNFTYKHQTIRIAYTAKSLSIYQTGGDRDASGWIRSLASKINVELAK